MKPYKIFSDSSCDLTKDLLEKYNITTVPFYVSFDKENYMKEIEEISIADFYKKLTSEKVYPKTSLPSVMDYSTYFEKAILGGYDILCLNITEKFSGSHQSAMSAKQLLEEKYPEAHIEVIDSILVTGAQGLILLEAAKMQQSGYTLDENTSKLNEIKHTGRVMFTLGTLDYLQKGGRIGKVSALAGNLLNLKPLIILETGELIPYGKARGFKKAMASVLEMVSEFFDNNNLNYNDYEFCTITGTNFEDATTFKTSLGELVGKPIEYPVFTLGTTIGTYTGPDIVGACFIRKYDR